MSLIQAQPELTEATEVRLVLDGNVEAFRDLVRPHRRCLYLKALSIVGTEADAEEVAQNAVLKAFTKLSQFRHESQFRTWLISITINEARMWLRSNRKYRHESLDYLNHKDGEDWQVVREFADPRESPFQVLERKQVRSTILKALTLLPSLYRRVFVLRDLQLPTASTDDANLAADPRLKYVPVSVRHQWEQEALLMRTSPEELEATKKQSARELQLVNAIRRAGVQFMAGTDGPDPNVFPGFSLHTELEWLVKSGFSPAQALQSATFNPALFLAKLDKFGVIETGHAADLVLLEANPLEDIRNTRKIAAVLIGGQYYSRQELDKMLAQIAEMARTK